jgi:hypothetical protein
VISPSDWTVWLHEEDEVLTVNGDSSIAQQVMDAYSLTDFEDASLPACSLRAAFRVDPGVDRYDVTILVRVKEVSPGPIGRRKRRPADGN